MSIEKIINDAWESRDKISPNSDKGIIDAVNETIELLVNPHCRNKHVHLIIAISAQRNMRKIDLTLLKELGQTSRDLSESIDESQESRDVCLNSSKSDIFMFSPLFRSILHEFSNLEGTM